MKENIRVLVADDHAMVRQGFLSLINSEPGMEVVGQAGDGDQAVHKARLLEPDVILMDLVMPQKGGIEAIREIKTDSSDARILVLTSFSEDDKLFPAIKAGAMGYLLKDSTAEELLKAIKDIYLDKPSLHPTIARKLLSEFDQSSSHPPIVEPLTRREVEVLKLVARGLSDKEIADKLVIGKATVRTHVNNILGKLHLANRTQAALFALQEGLVSLNSN